MGTWHVGSSHPIIFFLFVFFFFFFLFFVFSLLPNITLSLLPPFLSALIAEASRAISNNTHGGWKPRTVGGLGAGRLPSHTPPNGISPMSGRRSRGGFLLSIGRWWSFTRWVVSPSCFPSPPWSRSQPPLSVVHWIFDQSDSPILTVDSN